MRLCPRKRSRLVNEALRRELLRRRREVMETLLGERFEEARLDSAYCLERAPVRGGDDGCLVLRCCAPCAGYPDRGGPPEGGSEIRGSGNAESPRHARRPLESAGLWAFLRDVRTPGTTAPAVPAATDTGTLPLVSLPDLG